jgi:hypothetical protein
VHPLDTGPFAVRLLAGCAAAAFLWCIAAELGIRLVQKYLGDRSVTWAAGPALGFALIGSAVALLGVFHAARPAFAVGLCVLIAALRSPSYLSIARRVPRAAAEAWAWLLDQTLPQRMAVGVSVFAFVTAAIAAALPASWWDPIAYHLPIAAAALSRGAFAFDPGMVQSAFPALGEAAALPAYALAGSAGAAMATLFAGVALAITCAVLAQRLAAGSGALAAALVMSSALWLWLAPSFYVDIPYAAFVVAGLGVPLLWQPDAQTRASPFSVVAAGAACGALAGAAAAIKYPGLAAGVVALAMLLAVGPRQRVLSFGGFAAGFVALAVGWYARNFAATGDPVYPFLAGALRYPESIVAFAGRYIEMTRHWCGGGTDIGDLITLPWRLLADPRSFCGDPGYALRLGVIFAIVCVVTSRRAWPIGLAVLALTLFWFESSQQWRFLAPALALVAVLAAVGVAGLRDRLRDLAAVLLVALGVLGVLVNWLPTNISQASSSIVPGYAYASGAQDGSAYLRNRLETFGASLWLRAHDVAWAQVISLDDVRTYYFGGGIAWANPFYQQLWDLDWSAPSATRYASLYAHGYRYVVINQTPAYVRRTPTGVSWDVLAGDERAGALTIRYTENDVRIDEIATPRR